MAACSAVPIEREVVPLDALSEKQRKNVEEILSDVAAVVPLEGSDVASRPEVYDFLLTEMPFTGAVVRVLGRGNWEITRDADPNAFLVDDTEGMQLRFELIHRDATRRFYASAGLFSMGILPALRGRTLVVMRAEPVGGRVRTDAVIYVKVDSGFYNLLAKGHRETLAKTVRERSGYFIRAARWVAEESARDPGGLYDRVKGAKEVDQEVLEEYRKRFLAH